MKKEQENSLLGGLGILAAASWLCVKTLKRVDTRLKRKTEKKS